MRKSYTCVFPARRATYTLIHKKQNLLHSACKTYHINYTLHLTENLLHQQDMETFCYCFTRQAKNLYKKKKNSCLPHPTRGSYPDHTKQPAQQTTLTHLNHNEQESRVHKPSCHHSTTQGTLTHPHPPSPTLTSYLGFRVWLGDATNNQKVAQFIPLTV